MPGSFPFLILRGGEGESGNGKKVSPHSSKNRIPRPKKPNRGEESQVLKVPAEATHVSLSTLRATPGPQLFPTKRLSFPVSLQDGLMGDRRSTGEGQQVRQKSHICHSDVLEDTHLSQNKSPWDLNHGSP